MGFIICSTFYHNFQNGCRIIRIKLQLYKIKIKKHYLECFTLLTIRLFKRHFYTCVCVCVHSGDQNLLQILPWSEWSLKSDDALHHCKEPWCPGECVCVCFFGMYLIIPHVPLCCVSKHHLKICSYLPEPGKYPKVTSTL